jgi:hypothetical protein
VTATAASPLQRTLNAVFTFHDIFFRPFDARTPRVRSELAVSIPSRGWRAYRADDATYRFSTLAWEASAPATFDLLVQCLAGDYASYEPLSVALPLAVPTPPTAASFLITKPLWPTTSFRPSSGETYVTGMISHPTLNVSGLRVVLSAGAPDPLAPYTYTDARGGFLFRLPFVGGAAAIGMSIDVHDGVTPVNVSPAGVVVTPGRPNRFVFARS